MADYNKITKYVWVPGYLLDEVQKQLEDLEIKQVEPPEKCWYLKVTGMKPDINKFIEKCHQRSSISPQGEVPNGVKVENVSPLYNESKSE